MFFRRLAAIGGAILALAAAPPAGAAEFVLRFASINTAGTPAYDRVLVEFARSVERDSGGRIEMALKPLGGYGKPVELFGMVERGDIEVAATVQGYSPGRFPQSSVMELPLMFETAAAGTRAIAGLFKEGLLDRDYASVKVLSLYMLPPYGIFTNGRKMAQVKDLRGMRVRTPSPTVGLALSRLGMIPLGVPLNLMGETLANGTVDAVTYGWDSLTTTAGAGGKMLSEQVSVLIDARFAAPALMVVMNKAKWQALPAELQTMIDRHAAAMTAASTEVREAAEEKTRQRLQADPRYTAIALTAEQQAEMRRLIQPAVNDWKAGMAKLGIDGERLHARALELVAQNQTAAR